MVKSTFYLTNEPAHIGFDVRKPGPEVIKPSVMRNSAKYEIYPAHKC